MAKDSQSVKRSTVWAFTIYPGDSAPDDWEQILRDQHIPMFISPLHEPDAESSFKPHRHVMPIFDSLKSYSQVDELRKLVNGAPPIRIESQSGYGKYLTHLDNPEKQQWTEEQLAADPVIGLCGLNYSDKLLEWAANNDGIVEEIERFIDENDFFSFWRLKCWCRENNKVWYKFLNRRSIAIDLYMKSRLWTLTKEEDALYQYNAAKERAEQAKKVVDDESLIDSE